MAIWAKLGLGGNPNQKRLAQLRKRLQENEARLEDLTDQIRAVIAEAKVLKREYDNEKSKHLRDILAGRLHRLLDDLDRLRGRERIIGKNIANIKEAIRKLEEAEVAKTRIEEEDLEEIIIEVEEEFEGLKRSDERAAELAKVRYEEPERTTTRDVERRYDEEIGVTEDTEDERLARERRRAENEARLDERLKDLDIDTE